jgi:hypothetical protein
MAQSGHGNSSGECPLSGGKADIALIADLSPCPLMALGLQREGAVRPSCLAIDFATSRAHATTRSVLFGRNVDIDQ